MRIFWAVIDDVRVPIFRLPGSSTAGLGLSALQRVNHLCLRIMSPHSTSVPCRGSSFMAMKFSGFQIVFRDDNTLETGELYAPSPALVLSSYHHP
jgi:hypothetical protein